MDKPKISIIVPVFNMQMHLRECLDSIKGQTFSDWECILVDDGSTDSSPAICDEYASTDYRFKVIHKENGGLSDARNAGLRLAEGELIGFVDSDDWTEPEMFETLYDLITKTGADIAQIGYIKEYVGRRSFKHITRKREVISGEEAMREIGFDHIPNYVWNKLHRREIIDCDFPTGRNFEDIFVYGQWLKNVKKMALDPTPLYHYRMRKGSIIHADVARNRYDYFLSCVDRMKMLQTPSTSNTDVIHINAYINKSAVNAAKFIARREKDKLLRNETIRKISGDLTAYPLPSMRYMKPKTWWRAKLLRLCPNVFISLMNAVFTFDIDVKDREKRYYE
ncbi:MAG: glycosyltransferase [Muribaculaceae bacterium]|nr:glycosyltransferase [Muribaculaceae bacterium]